jgi:alkylation response protein AidB-like acyl-CoA dehydrogenase
MSLLLTEEQLLLKESAAGFAQDRRDMRALRTRRANAGSPHFDHNLWREMAALGWAAVPFEEKFGGLGLGYAELGIIMEELGRHLVMSPILSSVVMYGGLVSLAGSEQQKADRLPAIAAGERLGSFAYLENARHTGIGDSPITTTLEKTAAGYRLSGSKLCVLDGGVADEFVVLARNVGDDAEGMSLVLVPAGVQGLKVSNNLLIDGRSVANISFDALVIESHWLLGQALESAPVADRILDLAAVVLSAEMLGGIRSVFDMTLEYLKVREQFGAKVGSFQALKHRAARWFCEVELSKAVVLDALRAIDHGTDGVSAIASACKARLSDTYDLSGKEGIQMHGGIGVTDEHDVGLFMKHGRVTELLLGDSRYHRLKFAVANGY